MGRYCKRVISVIEDKNLNGQKLEIINLQRGETVKECINCNRGYKFKMGNL